MMKLIGSQRLKNQTSVKGADCYDRYRVRIEEMRQSCRMVLDAIEKIPGGKNTNYASGDEMIFTKAPTRAPEGDRFQQLRMY